MSSNTPDQQITIPVGADGAYNPGAFNDFVADVETRLVLKYTNLADRTARHTAPIENDVAGLASENRIDAYDGAGYLSLATRALHTRVMRTTDAAAINASTVLVNDAILLAALDVTGTYAFRGRIYYDSSTTADIKLAFTWPAASSAKWGLVGRNATTNTQIDALVTTASGTSAAMGGMGVGTSTFMDFDGFVTITATGTLQTQYAQNTSDATNTTVQLGSYLEVMKVA